MRFLFTKSVLLSTLIAIASSGFAVETIVDSNDFVSISTYEEGAMFPDQDTVSKAFNEQKRKLEHQKIKSVDFVDNTDSEFSKGKVKEHKLSKKQILSPFFIVGHDESSLKWLSENKEYLQSIHAIGLVIGFPNYQEIEALEKATHLPLVPANLQEASKIIGTKHYPVLVYKNWVTQ